MSTLNISKIAVFSVKGGVGKSTVSAGLCRALVRAGHKVGYMEVDISGTSGHRAFGIDPPRLEMDTARQKIVPPLINGIRMLPLAAKFTEEACVGWKSNDQALAMSNGDAVVAAGRTSFIRAMLTTVVDWKETEWLVLDLPPSTTEETFAFFECIPDLYGVILVSQPSEIAAVGLFKTVDFLKIQQKPVLGLVENMALCQCPRCGHEFYPFTSRGVDLKALSQKLRVPFLVSLPQVDDMKRLELYFDRLAAKVLREPGRKLGLDQDSVMWKLKRNMMKAAISTLAKVMPKGG